jgi:hypothetical protein
MSSSENAKKRKRSCEDGTLLDDEPLYVVAVISNPRRFKRRYQLYREFRERMLATKGIHFVTVEATYGERAAEVMPTADMAEQYDHYIVQTENRAESWSKESLINYGVCKLPGDWKYMAWIDADIVFNNPDWVSATKHALQHHPFVQMFQTAADLGVNGEIMNTFRGFGWNWASGLKPPHKGKTYNGHWHPGFAWACTREGFTALSALPDYAVLGSGDHHLAMALIGLGEYTVPAELLVYKEMVMAMQSRLHGILHGDLLGYVPGTILHHWHGKKSDRRYVERWGVLLKHKYNPIQHTHRDINGIVTLNSNLPEFQRDLRNYFISRNEDSVDNDV